MSDHCMNHIEDHWKRLTTLSNACYSKKDLEKALSKYNDALYRAEILNNNISDCIRLKIPFMQIYIISCNNIANTYDELGKQEESENMLKRVVYYLLHLASNQKSNIDEIQSELKRATLAYVKFAEKNNIEKAKQEHLFTSLKEQLLENSLIKTN